MTRDAFKQFSICLQFATPGNAPPWSADCAKYYHAMLADIPDADAGALMRAVGAEFKFRPSPAEILELWRQATSAKAATSAEEMVGYMLEKRRSSGVYSRRIPGDEYGRWEFAEPPWSNPLFARLSLAMGGWTEFCSDDSPLGVLRGQLAKAAHAILSGQDETAVDRLRLEYQDQKREIADARPAKQIEYEPPLGPIDEPKGQGAGLAKMDALGALGVIANGHLRKEAKL